MIDLDEVRRITHPIHPTMVKAHQDALATWKQLVDRKSTRGIFAKLGDTSRAEFIHDLACHDVANAVEGVNRVRVVKDLEFFALLVQEAVLIRFKYLGGERPANSKSKQQELLAAQQFDDDLMAVLELGDNAQPPLLVSCIYTLENRTTLASVSIRMDCVGLQPWSFPLWGDGYEAAEPTTFTNMPPVIPSRVRSTRKRPKRQQTDSGDEA